MGFQQATIPIQNAEAFTQLQSLIAAAVSPVNAPRLLAATVSANLVAWNLEEIFRRSLLEKSAGVPVAKAQALYGQLPISDQAQIREFYLTLIEQVDGSVRQKYKKAFRYS